MCVVNQAYQQENTVMFDVFADPGAEQKENDPQQHNGVEQAPCDTQKGILVLETVLGPGQFPQQVEVF
jgi:hypothetical protein